MLGEYINLILLVVVLVFAVWIHAKLKGAKENLEEAKKILEEITRESKPNP